MRRTLALGALATVVLAIGGAALGDGDAPGPGGRGKGENGGGGPRGGGARDDRGGPAGIFRTDVPPHAADVVAGRPTRTSVVLSARTAADAEGCVAWQEAGPGAHAEERSKPRSVSAGVPAEFPIDGLTADTAYTARFLWRASPASPWTASDPVTVRTQRPPGAAFTFTVQSDSHLDVGTQPALYERTVRNVAADAPDFHFDLGDTFMVDKRRDDFRAALPQYAAQRWYLGLVHAPVFLVLGNHDGETGWRDRGSAEDMPHWSVALRKLNFPNPEPGPFYTGNGARDAVAGTLQNWYAFEWGDAQFIALDPFWSTRDRKGRDADGWSWTLGDAQFRWLETTLAASRAKVRFVMIHHLVGGLDSEARGGSEAARLYEWGGRSPGVAPAASGSEFAARRPGWTAPIHDPLRRAGPTVVFHGHDHFFARQELDGVVYQMVPQPGHPGGDAAKMAAEYGYLSGDFLSSPGHLRVRVAPAGAKVEYVRSSLTGAPAAVAFTYDVATGAARSAAGPK
ncbi:MAG: metallophosphoesterase [Planctomycetes bacterium]|nr:metallophosphoesterase [Planctomycetota bacterium]